MPREHNIYSALMSIQNILNEQSQNPNTWQFFENEIKKIPLATLAANAAEDGVPQHNLVERKTKLTAIPKEKLASIVAESKTWHDVLLACGYTPSSIGRNSLPHHRKFHYTLRKALQERLDKLEINYSHLKFRKCGMIKLPEGADSRSLLTRARLFIARKRKSISCLSGKRRKASVLSRDLARAGRPYVCELCHCRGMTFHEGKWYWGDKLLILQVDHINGVDGTDNQDRLENLRYLCPNCHSQTDNFCRRRTTVMPAEPPVQKN